MSAPPQERIAQLCAEFHLPTVAAEVVPRFQASDHGAALATLLEVFELEAGDRRQRRVDRLRRAAKLPAGKTWDTLDRTRLPVKLQQQLEKLARISHEGEAHRPTVPANGLLLQDKS